MRIEFNNLDAELRDIAWNYEQRHGIDNWPQGERDRRIEALAASGDAEAQGYLANLYYRGYFGFFSRGGSISEPDYPNALIWARLAATGGNDVGHLLLFILVFQGKGTNPDRAEAVKSLLFLAERGSPEAQTLMGECFYLGKGVPESNAEALKWFLLADKANSYRAANNIADLYEYGHGVPENRAESLRWKKRAGENSPKAPFQGRHKIGDDGL